MSTQLVPFFNAECHLEKAGRRDFTLIRSLLLGVTACILCQSAVCLGQPPRALPTESLPNDSRLEPPKDLDGYFPFNPPASTEAWASRSEHLRRQLQVALGLWPMPERTPLNATIHGKIERPDYTVEKVYFESFPGFFVTGNLYRPKTINGKVPGILCPHGHWDDGRFMDAGETKVRQQIAQGAERFEDGGRSPLQSRCVQLARMGCVVFHFDMIGYADSQQIPMELAHGFAKQRPEMNSPDRWGLFSPQAEAHLQSVMGLQTWDSIRALDFLLSLPEVDANRVGVTGASGGGTQTFILGALDPRPTVAFPAVMVSTAMQGGCTCENACLLRIDTGNVEIAGLFAPKPLGMTAANDWTKEMETKGFPQLKQLFVSLGASENVLLKPSLHFGHNYNYVSRASAYSWFNKQFKLGFEEPIIEEDYKRLGRQEMSVWDTKHPAPEGGPEFERGLVRWLTEDAGKKLQASSKSFEEFRRTFAPAIDIVLGRNLDEVGDVEWELKSKADRGAYLEMAGLLRNTTHAEELPVIFLHPKEWRKQTVIWIDPAGKSGLFDASGALKPEPKQLVEAGATVVGVDLLFQGEFLQDGKPQLETRRVQNPREAASYTFGYNHALFAQRVHDILTTIKYINNHEQKTETLDLVGLGTAGPWVAAARAQAGSAVKRAVVETGGFRFGKVAAIHDPGFLPGGAKYGDLPGILALNAPQELWLAGESDSDIALTREIYAVAGADKNLAVSKESPDKVRDSATKWLLSLPAK